MSSNRSHHEANAASRDSSSCSEQPFCKNFLSEWIYGLAVVEFDLDIGPDAKILLSDRCDYVFRLPFKTSGRAPNARLAVDGALHGLLAYASFWQFSDPSSRRGCQQKSVVVLSPFRYSSLFLKLAAVFAEHAFRGEHKLDVLFEVVARSVLSWPLPKIGQYYELPFLGSLFTAFLTGESGQQTKAIYISADDLPLCQKDSRLLHYHGKPNLGVLLRSHGKYLWHIWELVLMNEPIMVFSGRPNDCSSALLSMMDLIAPIRFAADYRPYLTLQDADLKMVISTIKLHRSGSSVKLSPSTDLTIPCRHGMLIGVTNPFFIKDQEPWPNLLKLGAPRQHTMGHASAPASSVAAAAFAAASSAGQGPNSTLASTLQKLLLLTPSAAALAAAGLSNENGYSPVATTSPQSSRPESPVPALSTVRAFDADELFKCERRRSIAKDSKMLALLAQLSESQEEPTPSQEITVWRHFEELTERFMAPFYSYFQTLLPPAPGTRHAPESEISILSRPLVRPFHKTPFLAFLSERGTPLKFRNRTEDSDRLAFYQSFLATVNFDAWLQHQMRAAQNSLDVQYHVALAHLDLAAWYAARPRQEANLAQLLLAFQKAREEAALLRGEYKDEGETTRNKEMLCLLERQIERLLAFASP